MIIVILESLACAFGFFSGIILLWGTSMSHKEIFESRSRWISCETLERQVKSDPIARMLVETKKRSSWAGGFIVLSFIFQAAAQILMATTQ
jgi:hypothetical protein